MNSEEIRPLAERIHKESEGNPFIIDQIVRTLQEKELFPTEPNQQVSMKIEQILRPETRGEIANSVLACCCSSLCVGFDQQSGRQPL